MLVGYLLVGVIVGALAALASGLMGYSAWAVAGIFVMGANLGFWLSNLAALVPGRRRAARASAAQVPVLQGRANLPLAE